MPSALPIGRVTALLLLPLFLAFAQTSKSTASSKKKPTASVATKRPVIAKTSHPVTPASQHTRAAAVAHDNSGSSRVSGRKVLVTRKLVHGRWVRTSQVVHSESGPGYQTHPDTERYQQIQQSLAQKGYFKGEPNGQWGDDSVAALKQFQTERKIPNDGKISALSLIGLGLGPNRETEAAKTEPAVPADQPSRP